MASIKCTRCWKQVPPPAAFCPRCGCSLRPMPRATVRHGRQGGGGRLLLFLAVLGGFWAYGAFRGVTYSDRKPATEIRDRPSRIQRPNITSRPPWISTTNPSPVQHGTGHESPAPAD